MKETKIVAQLEKIAEPEVHHMVIFGRKLYITDGNKILEMELPRETIWQKIWSLIKF